MLSDKTNESLSQVPSKGSVVVLERKPSECNINQYNIFVLLIMYVASYIMKTGRAIGELLKCLAKEADAEDLQTQMKKVGSASFIHKEVSAQEAAYRTIYKNISKMLCEWDCTKKHTNESVDGSTKRKQWLVS